MKIRCLVISTFAVIAAASHAQTTTAVTLTGAGFACNGSSTPAFAALSLAQKVSYTQSAGALGSGIERGAGTLSFDDIAVTKNVDDCSTALYSLLFKSQRIPTVQISLRNGSSTEVLRITLFGAIISSIADNETATSVPSERVTIAYDKIVILDPATGTSATCTVSTRSCF